MHFGHKHAHNKKAAVASKNANNDAEDASQASNQVSPPTMGSVGGLCKSCLAHSLFMIYRCHLKFYF